MKRKIKINWLLGWGLLICAFSTTASAQFYGGLGYNQSVVNLEQANWMVDAFNEQGFLPRPMRKFRIPRGEYLSVGYLGEAFLAEVAWTARRGRVSALGADGNRREVRLGLGSLTLGGGINFLNDDRTIITLGTAIGASFFESSTRLGQDGNLSRIPFSSLGRQTGLASDFFVQFFFKPTSGHKLGFMVRPYFQYRYFSRYNWYRTHSAINDINNLAPFGEYSDRGNSLGIILSFIFGPAGFE